ncbi:Hypothetical predicted protein [Pelobates cultripes]|uniref:L1 transposable element RRM domain-containing protein n=1 Tax=Pelobates cultripes TaxID=61616 RepID=A0AAD1S739_PELCU|nr:Hypothetical predicted protein [Pelobates cultripes]
MGRTKRPEQPQTPRHPSQGPLDGYLQPQTGTSGDSGSPKMAAPSTSGQEGPALDRIESTLRDLAAAMVTKTDLQANTTAIQETLRTEIAGIRTELTTQAGRITEVEEANAALTTRMAATDTAVARQGEMLLSMRRHLEDVDNRGRRCNIRIRGVPETEGTENVNDTLMELFRSLLHPTPLPEIEFERAHRALRPCNVEDGPRDLICCLHSFPVKNTIMVKARERQTWPFRGVQVALYNDLSPITLEARRALRPVTARPKYPLQVGLPLCPDG